MKRQRGMAVVMALLLVALAATAVALVLWQQGLWWRQVESDHQRAQIRMLIDAELTWGLSRVKAANVVALSQPWARPMTLSEPGFEMHAALTDMQSRFNLNAMAGQGGLVDPARLAQYRNLLVALSLPPSLSDSLIRWNGLRLEEIRGVTPAPPRVLERWDGLIQVPGYTPEVMARLEPYAAVLPPEVSTVNVNTAKPLLLAAMLPQLGAGALQGALAQREQNYFRDVSDFKMRLGMEFDTSGLTANSSLFLLRGSVRQGAMRRALRALIKAEPGHNQLLWRQDGPGL